MFTTHMKGCSEKSLKPKMDRVEDNNSQQTLFTSKSQIGIQNETVLRI